MSTLSEPEFVRLKMIELRKTKGLTQKQFGELLGLSPSNISALELAKHEWSLSHMAIIRAKFGLPASLWNRADSPDEGDTSPLPLQRESPQFVHGILNLSPASKAAIFKYSQLTEDQRDLVDKVILNTAKGEDASIIQAILSLLRRSVR